MYEEIKNNTYPNRFWNGWNNTTILYFPFLFIDERTGIEIGGIIAFIFFILNSIFLLVEQIIANNTLKLKSLYLFETIFIVVIASYMLIKRLYFWQLNK